METSSHTRVWMNNCKGKDQTNFKESFSYKFNHKCPFFDLCIGKMFFSKFVVILS